MEPPVDRIGIGGLTTMAGAPRGREALVIRVAAFGARAMTGGKGGRLIQEEELRVGSRPHDRAPSATEFRAAGNPSAALGEADDAAFAIVQDATVAHQESAAGTGNDVTEGGDAILVRHLDRSPRGVSAFFLARPLSSHDDRVRRRARPQRTTRKLVLLGTAERPEADPPPCQHPCHGYDRHLATQRFRSALTGGMRLVCKLTRGCR
jgi:hypothetical protein